MKSCLCAFGFLFLVGSLFAQTNALRSGPLGFQDPLPVRLERVFPQPIPSQSIKNFFQLTERIYSGSSPESEETFADLQRRGIKTIISVDGAKPEVDTAKKYNLRYVHLPIGYDGISTNRTLQLVKAVTTLLTPIFVHCHHGKYRGPTGAAVICMASENWTPEQALAWLKQAGTATNYTGLYKSVEQFQKPSTELLAKVPANLPEKMEVSPLVDAMIEIDERFDNLKLIKDAGYKASPPHSDVDPRHEALLLNELFKEMLRSPETQKRNQDYQKKLAEAEKSSGEFHRVLINAAFTKDQAETAFQRIGQSCAACHQAHRN